KNGVWKLVSPPIDKFIIGTKWIFRNKLDENDKTRSHFHFAIFTTHYNIRLHQMNVKCAFMNDILHKEALYGLKQATRAWYKKLSSFLMTNGFQRGKVDTTLFCKNYNSHFIIMQIYVDDIILGAIDDYLYGEFFELMQKEIEISMMGELKFFLGLQIKQVEYGIYIHQTKYVKELLKKFNLKDCKTMSTPMHPTLILYLLDIMFSVCLCACFPSDPRESHLIIVKCIFRYLKGYNNVDFARDKIERKSISGGCHFIRANLVSWSSKRQGTIALSTVEHQLEDYDIIKSIIPLLYDNTAPINLSKNLISFSC
ncbi:Copia protein, partial [Mucuna pruriens]